MIALCKDVPLRDSDDEAAIDVMHIADVCSRDWGLYHDLTTNLDVVIAMVDDYGLSEQAMTRVYDRLSYGPTGPISDVGAFYGEAEKCVRVLLEKLPAQSFPKVGNLALAGNPIPTCLSEAYGSDPAKFQALVNATP